MRLWFWLCALPVLGCGCGDDKTVKSHASADAGTPCGDFAACGGKLSGNYEVAEVCFKDSFTLIATTLTSYAECKRVITRNVVRGSGHFNFASDNTLDATVNAVIDFDLDLSQTCLQALAGEPFQISADACTQLATAYMEGRFAKASCQLEHDSCVCSLTTNALILSSQGSYEVSGKSLHAGEQELPFCPKGELLRVAAEISSLHGTIVLKRKK